MAVPVLIPVTNPVVPIPATLPADELQTPPGDASASEVVEPVHIPRLPLIAAGAALMVIFFVIRQPVGRV